MDIEWVMDNRRVMYTNITKISDFFENEMMTSNIKQRLLHFKNHPRKKELTVKTGDGYNVTLFIPDIYFGNKYRHVAMGDTVWIYIEELQQFCCIYFPS